MGPAPLGGVSRVVIAKNLEDVLSWTGPAFLGGSYSLMISARSTQDRRVWGRSAEGKSQKKVSQKRCPGTEAMTALCPGIFSLLRCIECWVRNNQLSCLPSSAAPAPMAPEPLMRERWQWETFSGDALGRSLGKSTSLLHWSSPTAWPTPL